MKWINVKKDLPCNHPEMIDTIWSISVTTEVFYRDSDNNFGVTNMQQDLYTGIWFWLEENITHWLPIPEIEGDENEC